jgi:hypothetical protein
MLGNMKKRSAAPTSNMTTDMRADRGVFILIAVFWFLSWLLLSSSVQLEAVRDGEVINRAEPWLREGISHIVLLALVFIIPFLLNRFPVGLDNWPARIPVYLLGFFVFTVLHVLVMVGLRTASYPVLLDATYQFGLADPVNWFYEMRKDAFSFMVLILVFITGRVLHQLKLEASVARDDARTKHRLTLKCGGRSIFVGADEVIWAQAASNYVDIHTEGKTHLARMTLSQLMALLSESGHTHIRIHRSYVVKRDAVREIIPTGEGDAKLLLTNGDEIPASRRYRNALEVSA